jgi:hypothetical protein
MPLREPPGCNIRAYLSQGALKESKIQLRERRNQDRSGNKKAQGVGTIQRLAMGFGVTRPPFNT